MNLIPEKQNIVKITFQITEKKWNIRKIIFIMLKWARPS